MIPLDHEKPLFPASNLGSSAVDRQLKPFQQGHLDAYCGVYCIVNAAHYLCGPFTTDQADALLIKMMRFLEGSCPAVTRLSEGTKFREISEVVTHVVSKHHHIQRLKPYSRNKGISLERLWADFSDFLSKHRGVIILGIDGKHGHWTLVRKVTTSSLLLFDSDRLHRLSKRHCSLNEDGLHILRPTKVLYLWTDEEGDQHE